MGAVIGISVVEGVTAVLEALVDESAVTAGVEAYNTTADIDLAGEAAGLSKDMTKFAADTAKEALEKGMDLQEAAVETAIRISEFADFMNEHGKKGGVLPKITNYSSAYRMGIEVGKIVSKGVGVGYDAVVSDPEIAGEESMLGKLAIQGFDFLKKSIHSTMNKAIYGMIRNSKFIKSPKVQSKFDEIHATYNGKLQRFPYREGGKITYVDETGVKASYTGAINLNSITTLYGYWVGPQSYNDSYPLWQGRVPEEGKVPRVSGSGLLDSFCMAHDNDYDRDGYFDPVADYKLISRVQQNLHLMTAQEAVVAATVVAWFSTAGMVLSSLVHPTVVNFQPTNVSDSPVDIYSKLFSKKQKEQSGASRMSGNKAINQDYESGKKRFYQGLRAEMDRGFSAFASTNGGNATIQYSSLLAAFDNLQTVQC